MKLRRLEGNQHIVLFLCSVESPEVPDIDRAYFEGFDHPLILRIAVPIFVCPERVCDPLQGIYDWTRKIIRGVYFPSITAIQG